MISGDALDDRVELMKLLQDCLGSEFGVTVRHRLREYRRVWRPASLTLVRATGCGCYCQLFTFT